MWGSEFHPFLTTHEMCLTQMIHKAEQGWSHPPPDSHTAGYGSHAIRDIRALSPAKVTQSTSKEDQWWWWRRLKRRLTSFKKAIMKLGHKYGYTMNVFLQHSEFAPQQDINEYDLRYQFGSHLQEGNFQELMRWLLAGEWMESFKENTKMFTQAVRRPCHSLIDCTREKSS